MSYTINPIKASEKSIDIFCRSNNLRLPNEYMIFLKSYNGIDFINHSYQYITDNGEAQGFFIEKLYSIDELIELHPLFLNYYTANAGYKEEDLITLHNCCFIGKSEDRLIITLDCSNTHFGEIYFWDDDFGFTKVFSSFNSFFKTLSIA